MIRIISLACIVACVYADYYPKIGDYYPKSYGFGPYGNFGGVNSGLVGFGGINSGLGGYYPGLVGIGGGSAAAGSAAAGGAAAAAAAVAAGQNAAASSAAAAGNGAAAAAATAASGLNVAPYYTYPGYYYQGQQYYNLPGYYFNQFPGNYFQYPSFGVGGGSAAAASAAAAGQAAAASSAAASQGFNGFNNGVILGRPGGFLGRRPRKNLHTQTK
ncbi:spidroin-2-like [Saccostrea echinata]|uniref:spidroin-2-like n=1 Tax=Saccostrea echinata TaxID=191078 RepID=UPI002A81384D|nr:spidroin-2-like [Saccostrea echinata]